MCGYDSQGESPARRRNYWTVLFFVFRCLDKPPTRPRVKHARFSSSVSIRQGQKTDPERSNTCILLKTKNKTSQCPLSDGDYRQEEESYKNHKKNALSQSQPKKEKHAGSDLNPSKPRNAIIRLLLKIVCSA